MKKHLFLVLVCLLSICKTQGQQYVKENYNTLTQLIDSKYDLVNGVHIYPPDYRQQLLKHDLVYTSQQHLDEICIDAFTDWVDRFVGEKKQYVLFPLPLNYFLYKNPTEIWKEKDNGKELFSKNGSRIIFDPLYDTVNIKNMLEGNKAILKISPSCNPMWNPRFNSFILYLQAVVPFKGKFYSFETLVFIFVELNPTALNKGNLPDNLKALSSIIRENNQSEFVDSNGYLNDDFISKYFQPYLRNDDPNEREDIYIYELKIDPTAEIITLRDILSVR